MSRLSFMSFSRFALSFLTTLSTAPSDGPAEVAAEAPTAGGVYLCEPSLMAVLRAIQLPARHPITHHRREIISNAPPSVRRLP